jgi:hypothetical protein
MEELNGIDFDVLVEMRQPEKKGYLRVGKEVITGRPYEQE